MDPSKTTDQSSSTEQGASEVDQLINQFDKETQDKTVSEPTSQKTDNPEMSEVLGYIRQQQQNEVEAAINETVKAVKGDLSIGDDIVRGFIDVSAAKNKAIADAFNKRTAEPDAWAKHQEQLAADLVKQFQSVDQKATNDTNELLSAVQSSKQSTNKGSDDAPDFGAMSDEDFFKTQSSLR